MPGLFDDFFPNLVGSGYEITSDASNVYNCIAWALGITTEWWDYQGDNPWPSSVPRNQEVETLVLLFAGMGYSVCGSDAREADYEKIAIYTDNSEWTHAARQLENGRWTSKIGQLKDITNPSVASLEGGYYGSVHCIMRRPAR